MEEYIYYVPYFYRVRSKQPGVVGYVYTEGYNYEIVRLSCRVEYVGSDWLHSFIADLRLGLEGEVQVVVPLSFQLLDVIER